MLRAAIGIECGGANGCDVLLKIEQVAENRAVIKPSRREASIVAGERYHCA